MKYGGGLTRVEEYPGNCIPEAQYRYLTSNLPQSTCHLQSKDKLSTIRAAIARFGRNTEILMKNLH